jgi:sec-independent protein translocase protein TatB
MNSFFGIGIGELFFIAIIALVVLGPERLPGALREVGKFFRIIRDMTNELTSQFSDEIKVLDELNPQKILRELTDDPDEKAKAAKTATAAKPAAKPQVTPKSTAATRKATVTTKNVAKDTVVTAKQTEVAVEDASVTEQIDAKQTTNTP